MNDMKFIKRTSMTILLAACSVLLLDRGIVLWAHSRIAPSADSLSAAEAVLVPGAGIYGGKVSPILAERLNASAEVLRAGKAETILVSGDYGSKYYDEATAMKKYLMQLGIGEDHIVLDHAGFSTYDSILRAKTVFGFTSLVVVSQDFHLPRAILIARLLGIDAVGFSASRVPLGETERKKAQWREPLARFKALYDVLRHANPAFTGSGLPLDPSGNVLAH